MRSHSTIPDNKRQSHLTQEMRSLLDSFNEVLANPKSEVKHLTHLNYRLRRGSVRPPSRSPVTGKFLADEEFG
jgi:hypothetical protein